MQRFCLYRGGRVYGVASMGGGGVALGRLGLAGAGVFRACVLFGVGCVHLVGLVAGFEGFG